MRDRGEAPGMTMSSSHWRVVKPIVTKGRVVDVRSFAWDPDPSLREMNTRIGKPRTALPEAPCPNPRVGQPVTDQRLLVNIIWVVLPAHSPLHSYDGKDSLHLSSDKEIS